MTASSSATACARRTASGQRTRTAISLFPTIIEQSATLHIMDKTDRFLPMTRDIVCLSATGTTTVSSSSTNPLSTAPVSDTFLSDTLCGFLARTSSIVGGGRPNRVARAFIFSSSACIHSVGSSARLAAAAGPFFALGGAAAASASRDLRLSSPRRSPPGPPPRVSASFARSSRGKPRPGLPLKSIPFRVSASSIISRARITSGTAPRTMTVVPSRSASTDAFVTFSMFLMCEPLGPTIKPLLPRVSTSHSAG
mmetsp:Transcript_10526/g.48334  ORF Transcript_10526/g.48334 Transcript_10526/m.48334 type:complete len:253 (-) Transcript_10526:1855-2613(-)